MTLAELRAYARLNLNDAAGTRWSDADLDAWLNEGLDEWTLEVNQLTTTGSAVLSADTPANAFYTAPADAVGIIHVQYEGRELPNLVTPEWEDWDTEAGAVPWRIISGPYGPLKFRVWPIPPASLAADLTVFYVKRPVQMTTGTDAPEMPVIFHRALAFFAIMQAYLKDADTASSDLAMAWRAKWDNQVGRALDQQPRQPLTVPIRWY